MKTIEVQDSTAQAIDIILESERRQGRERTVDWVIARALLHCVAHDWALQHRERALLTGAASASAPVPPHVS